MPHLIAISDERANARSVHHPALLLDMFTLSLPPFWKRNYKINAFIRSMRHSAPLSHINHFFRLVHMSERLPMFQVLKLL